MLDIVSPYSELLLFSADRPPGDYGDRLAIAVSTRVCSALDRSAAVDKHSVAWLNALANSNPGEKFEPFSVQIACRGPCMVLKAVFNGGSLPRLTICEEQNDIGQLASWNVMASLVDARLATYCLAPRPSHGKWWQRGTRRGIYFDTKLVNTPELLRLKLGRQIDHSARRSLVALWNHLGASIGDEIVELRLDDSSAFIRDCDQELSRSSNYEEFLTCLSSLSVCHNEWRIAGARC